MIELLITVTLLFYFLGLYSTYQYLQMLSEMPSESQISKVAVLLGAVRWPYTALFMFWMFEIRKGGK